MGYSRTWDGTVGNYIQSSIGNWTGGPAAITCAGWAKVAGALPGDYAFMGRFEPESGAVTDGFRFALRTFSGPSIGIELQVMKAGVASVYQPPSFANDFGNIWTFFAVTWDTVAKECKFYKGATPATIAQLGTTFTLTTDACGNIGDVRLGQVHHEQSSGAFKYPMNGKLDHWGLFIKAFTLAELQSFAGQCNIPQYGSISVVIPIIGTSPEQGNGVGDLTVTGSLPTSTDTYSPSFTPAARCWPAYHAGEYLETGVNLKVSPAGLAVTCCAWVYIKSIFGNVAHAIYGAMNTIETAGFLFRISNPDGGGQIDCVRGAVGTLLSGSNGITTAGNFTDKAWFVACTIEPGSVKFYAGLTADSIAIVGNAQAGEAFFPVTDAPDSDYTIHIGQNHHGSVINQAMGGILDNVGLWYGSALTIDQLKLVAAGRPDAPYSSAKFFYKITGASPELDSSPNGYSATVFSTTVVAGLSPDQAIPPTMGLSDNKVQKPTTMSGGAGGGMGGNPTLDYGEGMGGGGIVGPMEDNARTYGPKGPAKGGKGGMLSQRVAPMFRGLPHLAEHIRRKR